jgi:hypothetical protein
VYGTPGIEGKLLIAIVNASGQIDGVLDFEHSGEGDNRQCRAFAKLTATKQTIYGPWVTWKMVVAEGWAKSKKATAKNGTEYSQPSKWETMPELMFEYRAGAFFCRTRFPHLVLGLQTREELEDVSGYTLEDAGLTGQQSTRAAFVQVPTLPPLAKPLPPAASVPPTVLPTANEPTPPPGAEAEGKTAEAPAPTPAPQPKQTEETFSLFQQLMSRLDRCRTGQGVTRILELAQQSEGKITDAQFEELNVAADKKAAAFISAGTQFP